MDIPPEVRAAAERLHNELRLHVVDYGCTDDEPASFNNDLLVVTEYILADQE